MSIVLTQRKAWAAIAVLAVLWLSAELRYRQLRHRLASLWGNTVSVRAVDEATGAPLPTAVGGLRGKTVRRDGFARMSVRTSADNVPSVTVVSDEPQILTVSSDGYQGVQLPVDRSSDGAVTVRLKKK